MTTGHTTADAQNPRLKKSDGGSQAKRMTVARR